MVLLEILAGAFAIFALTRVLLRAKERKLTWGEMIFWASIWVMMAILILVPELSSLFAEFLGIGRGMDLVIYVAIIVIFYLLFRLYVKVEQLEREVTLTVREIALRDLEEKNREKG